MRTLGSRACVALTVIAALAATPTTAAQPPESESTPGPGAQQPTQIAFGERGELVVDGKRHFIRASYRSGQEDRFIDALPSAARAGFDLVHDYRFESFDIEKRGTSDYIREARQYLRRAGTLGLGVFLGLPRTAVRAGNEETIERLVTALASEPALWMWYVYDEPRPELLSVDAAARVYALLRRVDPAHPAIVLSNRDETMRLYHPYCDVLWLDRYPITATRPPSSLLPIAAALDAARETMPAGKPTWPVVQAFDNRHNPSLQKRAKAMIVPKDGSHRPTEAEMRAQAHVAIARGAMAVAFYWAPDTWYSMRADTPIAWQSLSRVLEELGSLEPVLLAKESAAAVEVVGGGDHVLTWTRQHEGETYVGVVNADALNPVSLKVRTAGLGKKFRKLAGDGTVEAATRGLRVRLAPAGVAVIAFPAH